ncbi:MAG: transglutaminase domain-containing protein [Ginsengibacter sp.]
MKVMSLLIALICIVFSLSAQNNTEETSATRKAIPINKSQTSSEIADFINSHYQSEDQKVLAIYSWLVNNIQYDADSLHFVVLDEDNDQRVSYALRRRKGVCENFAAIFSDLCNKSGIPSFEISGFTKQGSSVANQAHMWCAAFVDNAWNLYDPTWDAVWMGNNNREYNYFKVSPAVFIQSHLPFDPLFQLLNYPSNYHDFVTGMEGRKDKLNYFNYLDSLKSYQKMDKISQYVSEESRINRMQFPSSKIDTKIKRLQFQAEVLSQDDDAALYNAAVEDYNKAIQDLNIFLTYRNNRFLPTKSMLQVNQIFQNIGSLVGSANLRLQKINRSTANLQLDTGDIQKKLQELTNTVKAQALFYKNYTASSNK